jgi:hypothetical protein
MISLELNENTARLDHPQIPDERIYELMLVGVVFSPLFLYRTVIGDYQDTYQICH